MCIIKKIVLPIIPKFVFLLTEFGKPGKQVPMHNKLCLPQLNVKHQKNSGSSSDDEWP